MRRSLANYIHIFEALRRRPTAGRGKNAEKFRCSYLEPLAGGRLAAGATFRRASDKAQRSAHVNRL